MVWESKLEWYAQVVRSCIFTLINICYCKRYLTFSGGTRLPPQLRSKPLHVCRGVATSALSAFHGAPFERGRQTAFFRLPRSFCHLHLHRQDPAKLTEHEACWRARMECATRNNSYMDPARGSAYPPSSWRTCIYKCLSIGRYAYQCVYMLLHTAFT